MGIKHIYAVETVEELRAYQTFVQDIQPKLDAYLDYLRREFEVVELPRAIVWTSGEIATHLISDIPVPAYTNEVRTVFCPELAVWRELYLRQLDGLEGEETERIRAHYHTLSQNAVLQILGHEMAHHSELFFEDFDRGYSNGIWFEEGMVELISRQYFLTQEEYAAEAEVNRLLVRLYQVRHGRRSLEQFGQSTYEGDYAGIFYEYWRSFLAVQQIADACYGDIHKVFQSYHAWHHAHSTQTLEEWFQL